MKFLAIFLIGISFTQASALGNNTPLTLKVCHPQNLSLCTEVSFETALPNSYEEQKFNVKVLTPENSEVQNMKVKLWMKMDCAENSHPGAPVQIHLLEDQTYQITKAHFFMVGAWEIVSTFEINSTAYEIRTPLEIKL